VHRFVLASRVPSRSSTVIATVSVAGEVVGSPAYQTAWGLSALLVARYDIAAINPAVIVKIIGCRLSVVCLVWVLRVACGHC
jgi:hypothetical protein